MTTMSLDEFRARVRSSEPAQERIRQLQAQTHEAVRASAVTGHPDWDHFLAAVEGRIKSYQAMVAAEQVKLSNPALVNADEIMFIKVRLACLNEGCSALEDIIELPKRLIGQGADAADRLRNLSPNESENSNDSHSA